MANGFNFNANALLNSLANLDNRMQAMVAVRLETSAQQLENYAKQNRPWKDRTGRARQGLNCRVERPSTYKYKLRLAHSVSYGAKLEFDHNKRYAIIFPTLERKGPDVMNQFNRLLEGAR